MKLSILTILLFLCCITGYTQSKPYKIGFSALTDEGSFKPEFGFTDSLSFPQLTDDYVKSMRSKGYLLANTDKLTCSTDSCMATIYVGDRFEWIELNTSQIPNDLLAKIKFKPKQFVGQYINTARDERLMADIQEASANEGYPLSITRLDSIQMNSGGLKAQLYYESGPLVTFDSLNLTASFIKPKFLSAYLNIKQGDQYSSKSIKQINNRMSELKYLRMNRPQEVSFSNNKAQVSLDLKAVKANKIDAILGLLQQPSGKLRLTGYVDIELNNLFKSGKQLGFMWRQFDQQSQLLKASYSNPNLVQSPLGFNLAFNLLKQDTTFTQRDFTLGLSFNYGGVNLAINANFMGSRLLGSTAPVEQDKLYADFNLQYYGFQLSQTRLDDPINPLNGFRWDIASEIGNKSLIQNNAAPLPPEDSLARKSIQYRLVGSAEGNKNLGSVFVAHMDVSYGFIFNNTRLFTNDMFRVGGLNSLRGFNEFEFYTPKYLLTRYEARILIGEQSRLFGFYDLAFVASEDNSTWNYPMGFGAGMVLGLGAGNLQLVYALGNSKQQSLSLNQAKIHLGYVAKF